MDTLPGWVGEYGCDVVDCGPDPGEIHRMFAPGDKYVECRRCCNRTYLKDLPDGVPEACPVCAYKVDKTP